MSVPALIPIKLPEASTVAEAPPTVVVKLYTSELAPVGVIERTTVTDTLASTAVLNVVMVKDCGSRWDCKNTATLLLAPLVVVTISENPSPFKSPTANPPVLVELRPEMSNLAVKDKLLVADVLKIETVLLAELAVAISG